MAAFGYARRQNFSTGGLYSGATLFEPEAPTADAVRAYRDQTGAGLMEAKRHLVRQKEREALERLRRSGTLEDKIEFLLNRYVETLQDKLS